MSVEEFKEKVDGYIAMVLDNQLSKDDAGDATMDCLTAVDESEHEQCYEYYENQWVEVFYGGKGIL